MALIGKEDEFRPDHDGWDQYTERLEHYFGANGITDSGKQRAILLTVTGAKAYSLLRNLVSPAKPGNKTFDELCALMKRHYNPVPSEIVQRCKFNSRFRSEGESVADFVASLRSLAEHCNYGQQLDMMLRDRLICGINDDNIQCRLLSEQKLDLKGAIDIAQGIKTANANVKDLKCAQASSAAGQGEVHKFQSTSSSPKSSTGRAPAQQPQKACYRCGATHSPDTCRFRNNTCFNCGKTGHIARVCRSRRNDNVHVVDEEDAQTSEDCLDRPEKEGTSQTHSF
ncbi:uncharacterized protein [Diadema antillarum]|uniref:uncharacterized protein n=1 Tax=Diadema antillarum TaxID=105358 RepID=UPI003A83DD9B